MSSWDVLSLRGRGGTHPVQFYSCLLGAIHLLIRISAGSEWKLQERSVLLAFVAESIKMQNKELDAICLSVDGNRR